MDDKLKAIFKATGEGVDDVVEFIIGTLLGASRPIEVSADERKRTRNINEQIDKGVRPKREATPDRSSNGPTRDELIRAMQEVSGDDPVATMSGQMVKNIDKYPVFQENPFLPIAVSQLESRGFKDFGSNPLVTKPKQGFGYGVHESSYNPPIETVLEDMMSAVGSERKGDTPERQRTASYYQPFREDPSDIKGFARTYAGPADRRNPHAGGIYASNLATVMNRYAEALDKIMKERGSKYEKRY